MWHSTLPFRSGNVVSRSMHPGSYGSGWPVSPCVSLMPISKAVHLRSLVVLAKWGPPYLPDFLPLSQREEKHGNRPGDDEETKRNKGQLLPFDAATDDEPESVGSILRWHRFPGTAVGIPTIITISRCLLQNTPHELNKKKGARHSELEIRRWALIPPCLLLDSSAGHGIPVFPFASNVATPSSLSPYYSQHILESNVVRFWRSFSG